MKWAARRTAAAATAWGWTAVTAGLVAAGGCVSGPSLESRQDPAEPLRLRLPDDAALYVLLRPADLHRAMDELGTRLAPARHEWGPPGGLLGDLLGAGDLGLLKGLARADFFEKSGLDRDGVVALALLRAPVPDEVLGRVMLHTPKIFSADDCPAPRMTLVAPVRSAEAAVHYSQRRRLSAEVDGSWAWFDGRALESEQPAPARWRLPEMPTAARPLTARLSLDRLGRADLVRNLSVGCRRAVGARGPDPPAIRAVLKAADGCAAAWSANPPVAYRLDARLDAGANELALTVALELTSIGSRTLRAGLDAPGTDAIPPDASIGLRVRFDQRKAEDAHGPAVEVTPAPGCELFNGLGSLVRWPLSSASLPDPLRRGLLHGATTVSVDFSTLPSQPLSVAATVTYAAPAAAVSSALRRGMRVSISPGEETVTSVPFLNTDLRAKLEGEDGHSRLTIGFGVPLPEAPSQDGDLEFVSRLVVRPSGLDGLAAVLPMVGVGDWMSGWTKTDVTELEADVWLAPPRLVGALRVRWNPPGTQQ